MAGSLLLCAAVPFNLPADSLGARRLRRKEVLVTEDTRQQLVMAAVAAEAAEAVQFVLGPRHRHPAPSLPPSPTYTLGKLGGARCPPNTPLDTTTFTFDLGEEADCEEDEEEKIPEKKNRKRRRLCSFSTSSPATRRVPHKKPVAEPSNPGLPTPLRDSGIIPKMQFYKEVQEAVADTEDGVKDEEKWRKLGASLRNIADMFGDRRDKELGLGNADILPDGVLAAVLKYVFWKFFFKSFK